jgi:hypothetical protein
MKTSRSFINPVQNHISISIFLVRIVHGKCMKKNKNPAFLGPGLKIFL